MTHHLDLSTVTLKPGAHTEKTPGEWCVMEAVAYFADEPWSDRPQCVSPVITAFLVRWNDDLDDAGRQRLVPYIPKVVGTNTGAADDERRAWMLTDWMVRTYLPAWLRLSKLEAQARAVEGLAELTSAEAWASSQPTVMEAQTKARAAWEAAWPAAWEAAWEAARAAAREAAWAGAREAAWDAAREAAWEAAWVAARAAAWAAAGEAARDAAGEAARDAAGEAALRPTVVGLQASALELLDRMIAVGADVKA